MPGDAGRAQRGRTMSDQPTSLFSTGPGPGSGSGTPASGLGGANTEPLDRPRRRELTWNGGTDLGLLLLRFAIGGGVFRPGVSAVVRVLGGSGGGGGPRNPGRCGFC